MSGSTASRGSLIARNSFWIGLDTLSALLAGTVISIAVARVMGPEKLGRYTYIMFVTGFADVLATAGVGGAVRRFAAEAVGRGDMGMAQAVVRAAFRWQLASAVVVQGLGLLAVSLFVDPEHQAYTRLAVLSIAPQMLLGVSAGAVESTQRMGDNVFSSVIANALNAIGTLASLALGYGLVGLTATLLVSRTFDSVLRYAIYRRCYRGASGGGAVELPAELRVRLRRFTWQTSGLVVINMIVWDRSEVLFLERFCDIRQVAFYSLSFNIMLRLLQVPHVFASAAGTNILVEQGRDPAGVGRVASTVVRYVALVAMPLTLGVAALSAPIMRLLYGGAYGPAIPVLAIVALLSVPRALLWPAEHFLMATENQGFRVRWGIVLAVVNLGLDLLWIPGGGAIGAALANGVAQALAAAGLWIYAAWKVGLKPPTGPLLRMLACAVMMAVAPAGLALALPPLPAILVGAPAGVAIYLVLLRWTRSLEAGDRDRFVSLGRVLPGWFRPGYTGLVRVVIP